MLLNMNLYCRNRFWIYLGDFLAISFVSCMVKMVGLVWFMKVCMQGSNVFSDAIFQIVI